MIGPLRNKFEKVCPKCGTIVIIKELNDGSPARNYDSALCPQCGEKVHEGYIVGKYVTEIKSSQE